MNIIESNFVPYSRLVYSPPKNRRDQRKRWVINQRRRKRGVAILSFTKEEKGVVIKIGEQLFMHPKTYAALKASLPYAH